MSGDLLVKGRPSLEVGKDFRAPSQHRSSALKTRWIDPSFLIPAIQTASFLLAFLWASSISSDVESILLLSTVSWMFAGAAIIMASYPDSGVSLALCGPVVGLLFFLPFLLPVDDHNPLILTWVVWLLVSVVAGQARRSWKGVLWKDKVGVTGRLTRSFLLAEILGSSVMTMIAIVMLFGSDFLLDPLTLLLAISLPLLAWYSLPKSRESLYLKGEVGEEGLFSLSSTKADSDSRRKMDPRLLTAAFFTGILFCIGGFLPMLFAVAEGFSSQYILGGILFVVTSLLRTFTLTETSGSARPESSGS